MVAGGHFGSPIWAIFDDRKSLSIVFLAISDQYTTSFFGYFFQNGRRPKTIWFFHYVLSMAMPNMKLISELMTQLKTPQAFWAFLDKMAARSHFVFSIDAKNYTVRFLWSGGGGGPERMGPRPPPWVPLLKSYGSSILSTSLGSKTVNNTSSLGLGGTKT